MAFPILLDEQQARPVTFAEPGEEDGFSSAVKAELGNVIPFVRKQPGQVLEFARRTAMQVLDPLIHPEPYANIFKSSEKSQILVENSAAEADATNEVYSRRIAAIKAATGVTLDHPDGYRLSERELRAINRDGPVNPTAWKREQFESQLEALRQKHPDKAEALAFGDIGTESRALAKGATEEQARAAAADVEPVPGFLFGMAGGMWGQRRDPLFVGSMFAGPTSAVGSTALARVATSSLFQGFYNAGISALAQPTVQDWRAQIGVESGVVPAVENVGMAFVMGLIPGAIFRGVHEMGRPSELTTRLKRTMDGSPEPGDIEALANSLGMKLSPDEVATFKAGMESVEADRAVLPARPPDVSPAAAPGHVRLYRGESKFNEQNGGYFTTDRDMASTFGKIQYVDLPAADAAFFKMPGMKDIYNLTNYEAGPSNINWRSRAELEKPSGISPQLHDDLTAAALKHAEDPINEPAPAGVAFIDAYHGSPHDFDRFDVTRIGTGEGAQSYGHGLYFAENAAVATDYAKKLSSPTGGAGAMTSAGIRLSDLKEPQLYRTRIHADREHFLDWDKPLSEQSEFVKDAFRKRHPWPDEPEKITGADIIRDWVTEGQLHDAGIPGIKYLDQGSRIDPDMFQRLTDNIERHKADIASGDKFAQARLDLTLKDLADFERRGQSQTSNFVVFDDKLIEITHKNDRPLNPEVIARVEAAKPETLRDAQLAATEALEDIGNRETIAQTKGTLDAPVYVPPPVVETPQPTGRARNDILDKVPHARDDGSPIAVTPATLAKAGEKETAFAMLVRSCK